MGEASPIRPYALVVEDEEMQRELLSTLLEECDFEVLSCDRAETALDMLEEAGPRLAMLFTDIELSGEMTGTELAHLVHRRFPRTTVIVTSGGQTPTRLPNEAKFIPKPWRPLDVLREAERSLAAA
jgi:DNA-binding NtrC family response regulator